MTRYECWRLDEWFFSNIETISTWPIFILGQFPEWRSYQADRPVVSVGDIDFDTKTNMDFENEIVMNLQTEGAVNFECIYYKLLIIDDNLFCQIGEFKKNHHHIKHPSPSIFQFLKSPIIRQIAIFEKPPNINSHQILYVHWYNYGEIIQSW